MARGVAPAGATPIAPTRVGGPPTRWQADGVPPDEAHPDPRAASPTGGGATGDPVLERRARVARITALGQRLGYALFALALVTFFVGLVVGWSGGVSTVIIACLVAGSAVLAPAIVFSYAVKAADRADAEGDW